MFETVMKSWLSAQFGASGSMMTTMTTIEGVAIVIIALGDLSLSEDLTGECICDASGSHCGICLGELERDRV